MSGLLCLPCVLFAPERVKGQLAGRLVTEPLLRFDKLTGQNSYLDTHLSRDYHESAVTQMNCCLQTTRSGDVSELLKTQESQQIARNRKILRAIIHEIETCGRLNLALRGHCDSGTLPNTTDFSEIDYTQGILRALIQKAALRDPVLKDHLQNCPKNAMYLSPLAQNNIISCIAKVMTRHIVQEVNKSIFFNSS